MKRFLILIMFGLIPLSAIAAGDAVSGLLAGYKAEGAGNFSAERGKTMWNEQHAQADGKVSCASCHGADLTKAGEHMKTGKLIEPMAPSVNPERLTDPAKVEKWFLRNCKSTLGCECTAQEKGDFLAYIQTN
ncbi:MAG TPA: DUF1924 domain-containing protein [Mariprofundaceae bacterium]|nr:DUF1924 domain-containing protein [Mariprofundaceae bacterium]